MFLMVQKVACANGKGMKKTSKMRPKSSKFNDKSINKSCFFEANFWTSFFSIFVDFFQKWSILGPPSKSDGVKNGTKIRQVVPQISNSYFMQRVFGGTQNVLLPGSFLERSWPQFWSIWDGFEVLAPNFFIKNPFRNHVNKPPQQPQQKSRTSEHLQNSRQRNCIVTISARSLPGSARNLPRISWSTIASTHLPHIHWPRNASQVTNCQAPKRGGRR